MKKSSKIVVKDEKMVGREKESKQRIVKRGNSVQECANRGIGV
jgi:hypothetical protein